jgi:hypothetical protein
LKPLPKTLTDHLWQELNRISASAAIAKTFIETLPDGSDAKIRLTMLHTQITTAAHNAMQHATDIKTAAASI